MSVKNILKVKNWRDKSRNMNIDHEVSNFTKNFRINFSTLLISALGLVAALSWQEAIKEAIINLFPGRSTVIYKLYIAIIITVIAVTFTYFLSKFKTSN